MSGLKLAPKKTKAGKGKKEDPKQEASPEKKKSRKQMIRDLLQRLEAALAKETPKATLADFIRLTQLERELEEDEQPGEIVVTWKEPMAKQGTEK